MRTSVRQCCLSVLGGYRYWISPFLGQPVVVSRPALNMRVPRSDGMGVRGRKLATCRLLKCHSFHPGGMGPVK